MKPGLLLDTSAWFAALNSREQHHQRAQRYYQNALAGGKLALVTTNLVVAEMHALISRQGAAAGVRFLDHLAEDPLHEVVWVTREMERRSIDRWLRPFSDHRFSLADAASFEVMRERALRAAFTLDRHFATAGFQVVP